MLEEIADAVTRNDRSRAETLVERLETVTGRLGPAMAACLDDIERRWEDAPTRRRSRSHTTCGWRTRSTEHHREPANAAAMPMASLVPSSTASSATVGHAEHQRDQRAAGGLAEQAGRRQHAAAGAGAVARRAGDHQAVVGRLEEAEADAAHREPPGDVELCRRAPAGTAPAAGQGSSPPGRSPPSRPAEYRSARRPAIGAITTSAAGHGVISTPIWIGDRPLTYWK